MEFKTSKIIAFNGENHEEVLEQISEHQDNTILALCCYDHELKEGLIEKGYDPEFGCLVVDKEHFDNPFPPYNLAKSGAIDFIIVKEILKGYIEEQLESDKMSEAHLDFMNRFNGNEERSIKQDNEIKGEITKDQHDLLNTIEHEYHKRGPKKVYFQPSTKEYLFQDLYIDPKTVEPLLSRGLLKFKGFEVHQGEKMLAFVKPFMEPNKKK